MYTTKEEYKEALKIIEEYKEEQKYLSKYKGNSICPFCNGSKYVPMIKNSNGRQDCKSCDENGEISNKKLAELDLI